MESRPYPRMWTGREPTWPFIMVFMEMQYLVQILSAFLAFIDKDNIVGSLGL